MASLSRVDDSQSLEHVTLYSKTLAPPSGCLEHCFWSPAGMELKSQETPKRSVPLIHPN